MNKQLQGFIEFIKEQGVLGLAIGLVLGTAIKNIVDSLVTNIINPIIGMILGGVDLSSKYVCLNSDMGECVNKLAYGVVINNIIQFIAVCAVIYFVANRFITKPTKDKK